MSDILAPGRRPRPVLPNEQEGTSFFPSYPANSPSKERSVLPTLVATRSSFQFRDKGPGMIFEKTCWTGLSP